LWLCRTVCSSYAKTFSFLCESNGIEVYYCSGAADDGNGQGFNGPGHAWNKVKSDGVWYYIDTYWNAGLGNFKYFLSETLWSDHMLRKEGSYYDIWYSGESLYRDGIY